MSDTESKEVIEFDPSKIDLGLTDAARAIMEELKTEVIYIEDNYDRYEPWVMRIMVKLLHGFEHKEFRTYPVSFRFTHNKEEETKVLPFRVFLFNIIMWYPQIMLDPDKLTEDLIIPEQESPKVTPKYIKSYADSHYIIPYRDTVKNHYLNETLSDFIYLLAVLCHKFFNFLGLSMNLEVFMDLARRIPEFDQLLHFKLDETKQPADMEKDAKEAAKRQWDLILNDPKFNILKPLLATNSLKAKQFAEFDNVIGLKPSVDGKTISTPINKNWITGEINEIPITFINDVGGRKAAIINNEFMGTSGHLLILVATLCNEAKLSSIEDCYSPNPTPIKVKSKKHLEKLDGRYYRFGGEKEYRLSDASKDTHLIGETIWVRSPATCCCEDERICKTCYGKVLSNINKELYSIGTYAAFSVMMKVTQDLLSAKHQQETNSDKIEFPEAFNKCFELSATDVIVGLDCDDLESYTLVIKREDIHSSENDNVIVVDGKQKQRGKRKDDNDAEQEQESSSDDSFKLDYYATKFYLVKNFYNKKAMEVDEIEELNHKELSMHVDFLSRMHFLNTEQFGECFTINVEDINYNEFVFMVDVENNELSKPLKQIKCLIDTKEHEGCNTLEEMVQKMLDLIIDANNPGSSVQGEIIVRQLIRDKLHIMERPDFSRLILPRDYQIMTINTALRKHPSITTSMSTPYLRYQLLSQMETFEKTSTSDMDSAFMETLDHLVYPVVKEY